MRRLWFAVGAIGLLVVVALWLARPGAAQPTQGADAVQPTGQRYAMIPVVLMDKRGNFAGSDRYLVDTWEGRVWVWANNKEPGFVPVPVADK